MQEEKRRIWGMALPLDADEGVLLQATEVERYGAREDVLNELVLTNLYRLKKKGGIR